MTGTCAQPQRDVAVAIKTARELALMPYSIRISASGSRGRDGRSGIRTVDRSRQMAPGPSPDADGQADDAQTEAIARGEVAVVS